MPAEPTTDALDTKQLLAVLAAFKRGDFSARMPVHHTGLAGKVADTLNEVIEREERIGQEFDRVSLAVGKEGQISQRVTVEDAPGGWGRKVSAVNGLVSDLVQPTSEMARVIGAVAKGDLSQSMALEIEGRPLKGEFMRTATIVNGMVRQLGSFAAEVTRVAREVGTDGKLGDQASQMVFLTGGAFTPRAQAFLDGSPNQRVEKPFDAMQLRALVNDRVR